MSIASQSVRLLLSLKQNNFNQGMYITENRYSKTNPYKFVLSSCASFTTPSAKLGLKVIKLFFMLNSVEHEICPSYKSQITNNIANSFLLNIAEHENFSANKYENANSRENFMLS